MNFAASPGGNYPTLSLGALGAVTYGGTIYPGSRGYYLGGGGGTLTLTTVLANTGSLQPTPLTINGPGEVLLRSTPTYTGSTTINSSGVLDLGGNTFNTTGTTVALHGGTLQDGTVVNNGSYTATSGVVTAALQGTANLTMSGPGLLVLANSNNSYGRTIVTGGVLEAMYPGALGPNYSSAGTVGVASGGTLEIPLDSTGAAGWTSPQLQNLLLAASFSTLGSAHATLALGTAAGNFTFAPSITGAEALASVGPNQLTLTGTETYSGNTYVTGGTLAIGPGGSLGTNGTFAHTILLSNGAVFDFAGTAAQTITSAITGGGALMMSGPNLLTLAAPLGYSYQGGTTISSGTLLVTSNAVAPIQGYTPLLFTGPGQLALTGSGTTYFTSFSSTGPGTPSLLLGGTTSSAAGPTVYIEWNTLAGQNYNYNGTISDRFATGGGSASLVVAGLASETFGGAISLAGSMSLWGGSQTFNAPVSVGNLTQTAGTSNVNAGLTSATSVILGQVGQTNQGITLNLNAGRLSAPGIVFPGGGETSALNLNGGTLQATAANTAFLQGVNSVKVNSNTVLDTQGNAITINQGMTGSGGLTKAGSGTLTLAGNNTYSGPTTIAAGTLQLPAPAAAPPAGAAIIFNFASQSGGTVANAGSAGSADDGLLEFGASISNGTFCTAATPWPSAAAARRSSSPTPTAST